jgi:catechol 2,3-dioxygenase-like lactoylglutathione lyase family enzyme
MIQVRRLGHATLTTPDLDRAIDYYVEIIGLRLVARDRERAFLASRQGLEAIALEVGHPNALARLSFQVAPGLDLAALARALAQEGIKTERRSDISPGIARAIAFDDPKGTGIDIFPTTLLPRRTAGPPASRRSSSATSLIASATCTES